MFHCALIKKRRKRGCISGERADPPDIHRRDLQISALEYRVCVCPGCQNKDHMWEGLGHYHAIYRWGGELEEEREIEGGRGEGRGGGRGEEDGRRV